MRLQVVVSVATGPLLMKSEFPSMCHDQSPDEAELWGPARLRLA